MSAAVAMTEHDAELYHRITAFEFDEPGTELTFAARLARENGWSRAFAERAIEEYKKFAFLAMAAGHPVCPSEEVDEVWHLHLTYTRSYWRRFCPLLGKPLHHHPTNGGPAELEKHLGWYQQTLASYRRLFACAAPSDLWPAAAERFYIGRGRRRVDLNKHWVIPKLPRWRIEAAAMTAGIGPLVAVAWNPFDFNGPTFILLYLILLATAIAAAVLLRRRLQINDAQAKDASIGPYEAAYLAGRKRLAIRAAIAALVHRGSLVVRKEEKKALGFVLVNRQFRLAANQPLDDSATALEKTIYDVAAGAGQTIPKLHEAADAQATELVEPLRRKGLLLEESQAARARWWPALLLAGLAAFGAIKIAVGVSRDRPVALLVAAVVGTLIVAALFLRNASRSRAGDRLLADLREKHARLNVAAHGPAHDLPAADLVLATALFGTAVLVGGPLDELRAALMAPPNQGGGGGSSGCGGGCGSGCGGGGCGGGCGGCGD